MALLRGVAHPGGNIPPLARGFEDLIKAIDQEQAEDEDTVPSQMRGAMRPTSVSRFNQSITYGFRGLPVNGSEGLVAFVVEASRYPNIPKRMAEISRPRLKVGSRFGDDLRPFPDGYEWGEFALGLVPKAIVRASGIVVVTLRDRPRR